MARKYKDKTARDNNRTDLIFRKPEIKSVLPEYFQDDYPNIITLLEKYYEWMDSADNPQARLDKLYSSRDATQVPEEQLIHLEDELLLGTSYFEGFANKREAIKFSNLLYRSKGSKFAVEQFFRGFYEIDPEVRFPKENIFYVGPKINYDLDSSNSEGQQIQKEASAIGSESFKYLTDDKKYQILSILIRSELPIGEWRDNYKLFAHPAGMYLASELVLSAVNEQGIPIIQDEAGAPVIEFVGTAATATMSLEGNTDITFINKDDYTDSNLYRQTTKQTFGQLQNITLAELQTGAANYQELLTPNSITFDESDGGSTIRDYSTFGDTYYDSADGAAAGIMTFDQHKYSTIYDSSF